MTGHSLGIYKVNYDLPHVDLSGWDNVLVAGHLLIEFHYSYSNFNKASKWITIFLLRASSMLSGSFFVSNSNSFLQIWVPIFFGSTCDSHNSHTVPEPCARHPWILVLGLTPTSQRATPSPSPSLPSWNPITRSRGSAFSFFPTFGSIATPKREA
jgi:hypothetical protein